MELQQGNGNNRGHGNKKKWSYFILQDFFVMVLKANLTPFPFESSKVAS